MTQIGSRVSSTGTTGSLKPKSPVSPPSDVSPRAQALRQLEISIPDPGRRAPLSDLIMRLEPFPSGVALLGLLDGLVRLSASRLSPLSLASLSQLATAPLVASNPFLATPEARISTVSSVVAVLVRESANRQVDADSCWAAGIQQLHRDLRPDDFLARLVALVSGRATSMPTGGQMVPVVPPSALLPDANRVAALYQFSLAGMAGCLGPGVDGALDIRPIRSEQLVATLEQVVNSGWRMSPPPGPEEFGRLESLVAGGASVPVIVALDGDFSHLVLLRKGAAGGLEAFDPAQGLVTPVGSSLPIRGWLEPTSPLAGANRILSTAGQGMSAIGKILSHVLSSIRTGINLVTGLIGKIFFRASQGSTEMSKGSVKPAAVSSAVKPPARSPGSPVAPSPSQKPPTR
ncbi:MAG: hypothetical protein VKP72_00135 [bacterium]|nr:hypothetical protein [bacterium]